jgi:hypothetical protein
MGGKFVINEFLNMARTDHGSTLGCNPTKGSNPNQ